MKILCKNKYWNISEEYNLDKILYFLIDRPTFINFFDDEFVWENKKSEWHREYDLPTFIEYNGYVKWCKNDQTHRENNKPAVIWNNGFKECWINGKFIKEIK